MAIGHRLASTKKELEANKAHIDFLQYGIAKSTADLQEINRQIEHLKKEAPVVTLSEYKYLAEGKNFRINEIATKKSDIVNYKSRIELLQKDSADSEHKIESAAEERAKRGKLLEFKRP